MPTDDARTARPRMTAIAMGWMMRRAVDINTNNEGRWPPHFGSRPPLRGRAGASSLHQIRRRCRHLLALEHGKDRHLLRKTLQRELAERFRFEASHHALE